MRSSILILLFIIISEVPILAQVSDLARIEYTYFPQKDSDNSFRRFRALANFPIKLNNKGSYLVPGLEYRNINFIYRDQTTFNTDNLERFSSFEVNIGITFTLKNNWRFATRAGMIAASNFEQDKLITDDLLFTGSFYFVKNKMKDDLLKPWRLILGLRYSTTAGRPFPLPFVNYFRQFHPSWSFVLGVPKTNVKYYFNQSNILQGFVTLDGFFANLQNNQVFFNQQEQEVKNAANISMTTALVGVGYEHYFTKHLLFYTYTGVTLINDIRLRNENREDVLTINDQNSFYLRGGIKLKI
ncbi:DUF6268 family outer membrane beta-barrel protein [Aquimarina spongiae]|uniref:Outer membrane protein beta-barrel domain-containing protein n=1 Tax=Aquimarina spongiae TaxID=570521 RepID=A0A1M6GKN3_9FLAO|nr:DUF6268 family outer membrane beta-barrel protein [Aquimarina spongiae]SHJ10501.1 hypothetical protein SAMN04488508_105328 [Aquimarina spongiae]